MHFSASSRRLLRELFPYRFTISVVILLGVLVAAIQPLSAKLTQVVINSLKAGDDHKALRLLPFSLLGLFVVGGFAKYLYNTLRRKVAELLMLDFRRRIFEKYLTLPYF